MKKYYISIRTRILILSLLIILSNASFVRWFFIEEMETELTNITIEHLKSIRASKARQIENYFALIRRQISTFSEDYSVIDAVRSFAQAYENISVDNDGSEYRHQSAELSNFYYKKFIPHLISEQQPSQTYETYFPSDPRSIKLQFQYIVSDPQREDTFSRTPAHIKYDQVHKKYHPMFSRLRDDFNFYDIFLVDHKTGDIVYSVAKEFDFATNLSYGPYKNTILGSLFKQAQRATDQDFIKLEDFEPYPPSFNEPASFIASPIYDGERKVGILIFQLPINVINDIMTGSENWYLDGHGRTGENILLGRDGFFRSQSRFLIEQPDILIGELEKTDYENDQIKKIISTNTSILTLEFKADEFQSGKQKDTLDGLIDYRGKPTYSAYSALDIQDVDWLIVTKIDKEEVLENLNTSFFTKLANISVYMLGLLPVVYWLINIILKPLNIINKCLYPESSSICYSYPLEHNIKQRVDHINGILQDFRKTCLSLDIREENTAADEKKYLPDLLKETLFQIEKDTKFSQSTIDQACHTVLEIQDLWQQLYTSSNALPENTEKQHLQFQELLNNGQETVHQVHAIQSKIDNLILLIKSLNYNNHKALQSDNFNVVLPAIVSELNQIEVLCFDIKSEVNKWNKRIHSDHVQSESLLRLMSTSDLKDKNGAVLDPYVLESIQQNLADLKQLLVKTDR
ncbi:MAG: cache domain-containing protein [Sneathiella sp.]|nr:cache domain-containing protein [Sneathiella sp.]